MERNKSFDMAKGLGILLVVLGHVPTVPNELRKIIYSFHIPLFFFISGYMYNSIKYNSFTLVEFIKSRFQRHIVPYFTIGLTCFLLFGVTFPLARDGYSADYLKSVFKYLFGLVYSRGGESWMAWSSPLWFLTCLFVAETILYLVLKHFKKTHIVFIVIGIAGYAYTLMTKFPLPWNVDVALTAACFMYIGQICKMHDVLKRLNETKYIVMILIVLSISILFNSQIDFNLRNFGNIILTYSGGISGSILVLLMTSRIKEGRALEFFGVTSLWMMGYTYAVLNAVMLIKIDILDNFIVNFIVQIILLSIVVIGILKVKQIKEVAQIRKKNVTTESK